MNSPFLFSSAFVAVLCYRRWLNKTRRALKQQKGNTQTRQSIAGVLTGISYVSGIDYYKGINELVRSRIPKGHLFSPNPMMVMVSVDCDQYAYNLINKNWSGVQKYLLTGVDKLVKAGIDFLVIASNTGHIGVPAIRHRYPDLPILHIADCTARAITAQGIKCVGLLGTEPTMRERFLIARLEQHGLRVLVPDSEQDMSRIFRCIMDELSSNIFREETRQFFVSQCRKLAARGACGIVLGCTEIEILLNPNETPALSTPLFCSAELHIEAAATAILQGPACLSTL